MMLIFTLSSWFEWHFHGMVKILLTHLFPERRHPEFSSGSHYCFSALDPVQRTPLERQAQDDVGVIMCV